MCVCVCVFCIIKRSGSITCISYLFSSTCNICRKIAQLTIFSHIQ